MYFRIYKTLNVLIWMIPCRKKVLERRWSTRLFNTPFAGMSVLLKYFVNCLTLINSHHSLYNCYIYMLKILFKLINFCFYLVYTLKKNI